MQAFLRESRALDVRVGFDLFGELQALFASHGRQTLLLQRLYRVGVVAQVDLRPAQYDRRVGTMMPDFGYPFVGHIRERARTDHTEADQKHVGLRIRQWS